MRKLSPCSYFPRRSSEVWKNVQIIFRFFLTVLFRHVFTGKKQMSLHTEQRTRLKAKAKKAFGKHEIRFGNGKKKDCFRKTSLCEGFSNSVIEYRSKVLKNLRQKFQGWNSSMENRIIIVMHSHLRKKSRAKVVSRNQWSFVKKGRICQTAWGLTFSSH